MEYPDFKTLLDSVKTVDDLIELRKQIKDIAHPAAKNVDMQRLRTVIDSEPLGSDKYIEASRSIVKLIDELNKTPEVKEYIKYTQKCERELFEKEKTLNVHSGCFKSNRAARAQMTDARFNEFIDVGSLGVEVKRDGRGNPLGDIYGLGKPGAFAGSKIYFIKQYLFDHSKIVQALEYLGFNVFITEKFDTKISLENFDQVWFVSDQRAMLSKSDISSIVAYWRRGGSLYILGDNDPYFYDANILLKACNLPTMSGDYYASRDVVNMTTEDTSGVGFNGSHPTLRGVVRASEGITIAHFDEQSVKDINATVLLRNTQGKISMFIVEKDAETGTGAIMASGCFTQLFPQCWSHDAARWKSNDACYLSVAFKGMNKKTEIIDYEPLSVKLDSKGALEMDCSITYSMSSPAALLARKGKTSEELGDYMLSNPFSYGRNDLVTPEVVSLEMIDKLFISKFNPFTRSPLDAVIPIVKMTPNNMKIITPILCTIFTGGKNLVFAAYGMFYATCLEYMINCDKDDVAKFDMFKFLLEEMDNSVKTYPSFTDDGVKKIPLGEAMYQLTLNDPVESVRLPLKTICLFAWRLRQLNRITHEQAVAWVRKSYIKEVVNWFTNFVRKNEKDEIAAIRDTLFKQIYDYECEGVIAIADSYHPLTNRDLTNIPSKYIEMIAPIADVLSLEHFTKLLLMLINPPNKTSLAVSVETVLKMPFLENWLTEEEPSGDKLARDVWGPVYAVDYDVHDPEILLPFVNTLGPTVLMCPRTGTVFDDGTIIGTQKNRAKYLINSYGANISGNPRRSGDDGTPASSSYSIHKHVRNVMCAYPDTLEISNELVSAVAKKLVLDGRGFFRTRNIENKIRFLLKSYLECRKRGEGDVPEGIPITFKLRYEIEKGLTKPAWWKK